VAFSKQSSAYEAAGRRAEAEQSCAIAVSKDGVTIDDFSRYVRVVLAQPGSLSKQQVAGVDAAIAHLKTQSRRLPIAAQLACDVGVRLNDEKRLARCISDLRKQAPNDSKTLSYEWAAAVGRGDIPAAKGVIARAKALGMPAHFVARMEEATRVATPRLWRVLGEKPIVLLGAGGVAALLLGLSFTIRRRRSLPQVLA
jgi:hypothetical protein